jgi:RNase H-fold protein (predicted Holliday junction resolvase)
LNAAPVLGIDPGTRKVGIAVVAGRVGAPLCLAVVALEAFGERAAELIGQFGVRAIALGGGTHTAQVAALLASHGLPIAIVDERETTLRARARYFEVNPPRGWRRLIPRGMLLPPRPIDDFAALLIAERFLENESSARLAGPAAPAAPA